LAYFIGLALQVRGERRSMPGNTEALLNYCAAHYNWAKRKFNVLALARTTPH
jgi:hypothetical protein